MFDYSKALLAEKPFADGVWEKIDKKLRNVAKTAKNKLPYTTVGGKYDDLSKKNVPWWTNGFWPGIMWLLYYGTKNEVYRAAGEKGEELLDEALKKYNALDHDVGFLWHISAGADYRITGNAESRTRNMYAASILAARFNLQGGFIRAWNKWSAEEENLGTAIIDCMMNIPLLYWASEESGDPRFKYIAERHAETTMKNHIRPDGSVKHIVRYDPFSGEYIDNLAGQGYSEHSAWSRGQAWALYGFVLSYIHTEKKEFLDTAKRVANYFIANICMDNYMARVDFRAPKKPEIYDSTADACAACGLLELARVLPEDEGAMYFDAAVKILKMLDETCCNYNDDEDSILQMGTERYPKNGNMKGVHIPIIYGDYYFIEAIYKLKGFDILFW